VLEAILLGHPALLMLDEPAATPGVIEFGRRAQWRRLSLGLGPSPVRGLIELIDNNPLVCADDASAPGAIATLALIALGPLARAGLIRSARG